MNDDPDDPRAKMKGFEALIWFQLFLLATGFLTWFIIKVLHWS